MKAFTERNPKVVGITAVIVMSACVLAILLLNRSFFNSGYSIEARFANAAGISKGTEVMEAGVNVGTVTAVRVHGNAVDAQLSVNRSVVLPHMTTAAIEVETLLGVVDVTLKPVSGWNDPLKPQALITDTSVPTEFYELQNTAHSLLTKTNAKALNNLVTSLATITKDKQTQVAQIISGLGALTTTVDQRSGQVSQLIDSANTLSSTLAGRDQQLLSIVNNLDTVSTGLAANNQDLANLITNVDSMASQTNSLVSQDSPALNSLLKSLHSDLTVVGQHQDDLAEGVSYLGGALKGFQSIAYSGSTPVPWGNIFVNPASLTNSFGVIGPCGAFDQVLNQVLGPDPASCNDQTGPLPGEGSNTSSGTATAPPPGSAPAATDAIAIRRSVGWLAIRRRWTDRAELGPRWPLPADQSAVARGRMTRRLRAAFTSKAARLALAGAVIAAAVVVGIDETKGAATYPIKVVYSSAPGLFTGAAVDVLGVKVGTVSDVQNVGDKVDVTLAVDSGTRIPATAFASLVAPQLLGSPDVDLNPGYTGGPTLAPGATIPQDHTAIPVSTDELLKELQKTLNAINPHAVGNLVSNLATDLDGQGASLNKLIASAAGTVQLLANKGNDLGRLNGTLAQLTGTLDTDTSQIEQLVEQYDTVSTTVAQHSGQLNDAITQLAGASSGLVGLLVPNLQPLEADVGTVTTVGRTLDRNLSSVDEILQNGNNLFQGAKRAYDPTYNWLDLNLATAPGVTGAYIAGLLRDRLAGICRRIVANHTSGLSAAVLSTLSQCGNPSSGFFDPLLDDIPTILNTLSGGSGAATAQSLLQQGLNQIAQAQAGPSGTGGAIRTDPSRTEEPGAAHHDEHDRAAFDDDDHNSVRPPRRHPRLSRELGLRFGLGLRFAARARARQAARRVRDSAACCPTR